MKKVNKIIINILIWHLRKKQKAIGVLLNSNLDADYIVQNISERKNQAKREQFKLVFCS